MNCAKVLTSLAIRAFSTRKRIVKKYPNPGVQNRLGMLRDETQDKFEIPEEFEEFEDDFEPDFSQAQKSYSEHQRESIINKEKLKQRIVARKYFKQTAPSFLTFTEREQIRYLHENDPTEWTPEKLSESFPVLPDVVRKILNAKWVPKSIDVVINHDKRVIENWKKFKSGELPLEPRFKLHLAKFKDRKITLPCREELAQKIIPPVFEFPKPKSTFFSSIVQSHVKKKKADVNIQKTSMTGNPMAAYDEQTKVTDGENTEQASNALSVREQTVLPRKERNVIALDGNELSQRNRENDTFLMNNEGNKNKSWSKAGEDLVTLDKYIENTLENMTQEPTEEEKVFMDVYKKRMEVGIVENENHHEAAEIIPEKTKRYKQTEVQTAEDHMDALQMSRVVEDPNDKRLSTYVKEWRKNTKEESDEDYPEYIQIPKNKFKEGMMYRVGDCYYDDDGEFLYRVPGIQN